MSAFHRLYPVLDVSIPMYSYVKTTFLFFLPFLTVFGIHYTATNAYAEFCAPRTFFGIFQSLLLTGSPVCGALLTIVNNSHNSFGIIVGGLLTFGLAKMATASPQTQT
jgi:hypothetical protein